MLRIRALTAVAPEEEIEITPEMIEAGACAVVSVNLEYESEEDAAIRIYRSMVRAKSK